MNNKYIYKSYLFPALIHITIVALLAGILKRAGCELGYNSILGIMLIVVGGVSSAFWGVIYQIKYNEKRPLSILKDFFNIRQPFKIYAIVIIFLLMDFGSVIVCKGFKIESLWGTVVFFLRQLHLVE